MENLNLEDELLKYYFCKIKDIIRDSKQDKVYWKK
jgi:hypothetical protein